jgi:anti-anti-sigma factor
MTTQTTPEANFPVSECDGNPQIQMPPRLTILEALAIKQACYQLLDSHLQSAQLILDFSPTQFIDSSGVGTLVHLYKLTQERTVEMVLWGVNPPVMGVLTMTGLDEVFTLRSPPIEATTPIPVEAKDTDREQPSPPDNSLPETHPSVRSWIKRWLDIGGSLLGLGITAVLFIPIAIAIRWDSPGPIFFTQTRCGWMGKQFKIIKFRSMCVNAEELKAQIPNQAKGAFFKNPNDPRITRVGSFLRRTSLDELPQFWNVLMGDMSLVGTRPPTPDEVERYDVPSWQRLNVRPGMTGEWQVNGRSRVKNFEDVIVLDLRYQENWSQWYDLSLILKTILILFRKNSGAI